jgi:hypothetical protein
MSVVLNVGDGGDVTEHMLKKLRGKEMMAGLSLTRGPLFRRYVQLPSSLL